MMNAGSWGQTRLCRSLVDLGFGQPAAVGYKLGEEACVVLAQELVDRIHAAVTGFTGGEGSG